MKDFYDIHLILNDPNCPPLEEIYVAVKNTWSFRHNDQPFSQELFEDWFFTIDELISDQSIKKSWKNYIENRSYAQNLSIEHILQQFKNFVEELQTVFHQ